MGLEKRRTFRTFFLSKSIEYFTIVLIMSNKQCLLDICANPVLKTKRGEKRFLWNKILRKLISNITHEHYEIASFLSIKKEK